MNNKNKWETFSGSVLKIKTKTKQKENNTIQQPNQVGNRFQK